MGYFFSFLKRNMEKQLVKFYQRCERKATTEQDMQVAVNLLCRLSGLI